MNNLKEKCMEQAGEVTGLVLTGTITPVAAGQHLIQDANRWRFMMKAMVEGSPEMEFMDELLNDELPEEATMEEHKTHFINKIDEGIKKFGV